VQTWRDHSAWVQNLKWKKGDHTPIVSASIDGEVRLWDRRYTVSSIHDWILHSHGLSAFCMHEKTDVFATSSAITATSWRNQTVIVRSVNSVLSRLTLPTNLHHAPSKPNPSSYMYGQSALSFHPNEMLLGSGGPDGTVKILGCKLEDHRVVHSLDPQHEPSDNHALYGSRSDASFSP